MLIWHPFLAETLAVKQSPSHLPGMDFSGIISVPNQIYNSAEVIWSSDSNYDWNTLNINNFNGLLAGIYEEESNEKDGDSFMNHYTHFCRIGFAISENLIKELRLVKRLFTMKHQYISYEMIELIISFMLVIIRWTTIVF